MGDAGLSPEALSLALAADAIGRSDPNPRVGCVLVKAGRVIGQGSTQQAGGPHAEVMALRAARDAGEDCRGAVAYVTLEPCAHHGRTPPCALALVEAGVGKVVVALRDPNPLVAGRGLQMLREAGIEVEERNDAWSAAARELNLGFLSRMQRGRPWVRLKVAVSLDGRTALDDGRSQWITSPEARADGHAWRRRAGAVLTGIGTVEADDPRLDVRLVPTERQPLRVVLDSQARIRPTARVLQPPGEALLVTSSDAAPAGALRLPAAMGGGVDLPALLAALAQRGVNELHVEAGPRLNAALLAEDLVDELLVYIAPMLIGPGRPLAALGPLADLAAAQRFEFLDAERVGPDLRLRLRPPGRSAF